MKLKRVEISGFKSFAGKETLHFEHPITAIVGPNGSGKSNVREAISYALGEQSKKTLRGKRGEDFVFNGSSHLPRLNRASVKIVFDNTSRTLAKGFDEIEIERTIHRDSSGGYYVNGSRVRHKDITELLSRAKIGSGSHHVVSQGEADKALSLSQNERRALVEESLGLSYPQAQKKEAIKKLEKSEENMREVEIRKREHLPHLQYLEREMQAIEEHKTLLQELSSLLRDFVPRKQAFFREERARLDDEIGETEQHIGQIEEKIQNGDTSPRENTSEAEHIADRIAGIQEQKGKIYRSLGRLEAQLENDSSTDSDKSMHVSSQHMRAALDDVRNTLSRALEYESFNELHRAIKHCVQTVDALFENKAEDREKREEGSENETTNEIESLKQKLVDLEQQEVEIETQRRELLLKQAEQRSYEQERENLHAQKKSLNSLKEKLQQQLQNLDREKEQLQRGIETWAFMIGSSSFLERGEHVDAPDQSDSDFYELEQKVKKTTTRIESMSVGNAHDIEREYKQASAHQEFLEREVKDLSETVKRLQNVIDSLTEKINSTFTNGLDSINAHFNRFFQKMFEGGSAKLVEVEEEKELPDGSFVKEKGIDVAIEIEHKRLRSLNMLSGGERTLVSIALVFALTSATPPPFLVLDETDAALDEANSKRYGDLIAELAEKSQLILITHNRETMSRAGRLYGITMGKRACSELLSIDLGDAKDFAK